MHSLSRDETELKSPSSFDGPFGTSVSKLSAVESQFQLFFVARGRFTSCKALFQNSLRGVCGRVLCPAGGAARGGLLPSHPGGFRLFLVG